MAHQTLGVKICSTCSLKIFKNKNNIECFTCGEWFHARSACIKSLLTCQQNGNWYMQHMLKLFPTFSVN